ncbi:PilZ domain-containing protein [Exilibacterium tricleocarpae]|uniref:PilZ domain-containing protein n=1 Tax=Exilibacterium tricleocarpae TaxID=2591008 RepID=A0A545T3C1_9GAMM|nr:PilZ domain-containing protein [Exilibacterium tricleocarpae]TQV71714.1 PilZ domain-containing protein [Exilibacterium tricleocarpae]
MSDEESRSYERKLKRHQVKTAIEVYDKLRGSCVGRLVNIHSSGLMLMGTVRLEADHLYQLDLHLPEMINGRRVIQLGVDCLWVRESDDPDQHWAGCQIIDKSDEADADIEALVELLEA